MTQYKFSLIIEDDNGKQIKKELIGTWDKCDENRFNFVTGLDMKEQVSYMLASNLKNKITDESIKEMLNEMENE